MSVGNSINYSIPVVGTTVGTYDRGTGNVFVEDYTSAGGSYPSTLSIRPAKPISTRKSFGISTKVRPADVDDPGTVTKGSASVSINIEAVPGTVMTRLEITEFIRYTLSIALKSSFLEDLYDGISL